MTFWLNDPRVLIQDIQFIPTNTMTFDDKLNAASRFVVLLSLLFFVLSGRPMFMSTCVFFLVVLCVIHFCMKRQTEESFSVNPDVTVPIPVSSSAAASSSSASSKTIQNPVTLEHVLRSEFQPTTKQNPFGNVLLTDIHDTPNRKAAAPSFNPEVYDDINKAVKQQTQMLNPSIINTNKQLYGDLKDNYDLDNSMMRFYSMPNTRVADDGGAFAKYLYGNMPSAKESNADGAFARVQDNYRYILR